jgi:hypothetical protein
MGIVYLLQPCSIQMPLPFSTNQSSYLDFSVTSTWTTFASCTLMLMDPHFYPFHGVKQFPDNVIVGIVFV